MVLLGGVGEVGVAGEQFADAEVAEVSLVFGQGRGDDGSAGARGELHCDAADAPGCADDQHAVGAGELERVNGEHGGDARERSSTS